MTIIKRPYLIEFEKIGVENIGFLSFAESGKIPFEIKRIYWTYFIPNDLKRSAHAHRGLQQVLLAMAGTIIVNTEAGDGERQEFILDKPNVGLYIPDMCWHQVQYKAQAALVSIASSKYDANDYIRDFNEFKKENFQL